MKKWIIVIIIIIVLFFLVGLDSILINNTINKPNFECENSADCIEEVYGSTYDNGITFSCATVRCLNKEWKPYNPIIKQVLGLSCAAPIAYCTCERNQCVVNKYPKSIEECDKINNINMKDNCLNMFSNNKEICKQISSSELRDECLSRFIEDIIMEDCEYFSDFVYIDWCKSLVTNDLSYCERNPIYNCYNSFAVYSKEPSICEKINGSHDRNSCYWDVAKITANISICELMISDSRINSCRRDVNEKLNKTS